jgi:hypothetical protein
MTGFPLSVGRARGGTTEIIWPDRAWAPIRRAPRHVYFIVRDTCNVEGNIAERIDYVRHDPAIHSE